MADLTLAPDFQFATVRKFDTLITNFENGVEQRRAKRVSPICEYTLQYRNRTSSDLSTIKTLFNNKYGAYTSFTWTNPEDSTDYTVRFKEDSLKYTYKSYGIWDFEFTLITVL
jgi:phage-related protein